MLETKGMCMTPQFRLAALADLDTLVVFVREFYAIDQYAFDEPVVRRCLTELIQNAAPGRAWLIEVDAQAAGYLILTFGYSLEFHGRDAFIDELFVLPAYRNQGLGAQAMQFALTACREHGVKALHLEVERTNEAAQHLYRKSGFEDTGRYLMTRWIEHS